MKLLFHVCCGPCATAPLKKLLADGHEVTGLFYNPNIHPYTEYQKRLESAQKLFDDLGVKLIVRDQYDLVGFLRRAVYRETERCAACYEMRLMETAAIAKHGQFDAFTSSLLVSPMQKFDTIIHVGREAADAYGVKFYEEDFRPLYKDTYALSKEHGLYRQQYCGCIYSERERYLGKLR